MSVDDDRRAGDIGITGVMCSTWSGERYRAGIERFADDVNARCD